MQLVHPLLASLALELEENIIDELQDNVQALRRCALVCRSWHIRSRHHLLRSLRIRSVEQLDELCAYFRTHPALRPSVKSLSILPTRRENQCPELIWIPLVSQLPSVQKLTIASEERNSYREVTHRTSFHRTLLTSLRVVHHATSILCLYKIAFPNPSELVRLLAALPSLRCLRCEDLQITRMEEETVETALKRYNRRVHISDLYVSACHALVCALANTSGMVDTSERRTSGRRALT